jgi:hypothetical protein
MADKIFGTDFSDTTDPAGTETISVNNGSALVDVTLSNVVAQVAKNATNKATPVDADKIGYWDSVSGALRHMTWANVKATLKTYFDTLYSSITTTRQQLTAARTYYVRTDGSDSNTGLANTAGGAFLTVQKAVDTIAALDINGQTVTVQIADGTYTGAVTLKNAVGYAAEGNLVIQGNSGTPANVVISVTSNNCFSATGIFSVWTIKDMKLQTTTSGSCLMAADGSKILFTNLNFGTTVTYHIFGNGGIVQATGNYTISGNAAYHWVASIKGSIKVQSIATITLSGTPAFTVFGLADTLSTLAFNGSAFSGGASAGTKKYDISSNGVAVSGGVVLPGGVAGTTATGGQYL